MKVMSVTPASPSVTLAEPTETCRQPTDKGIRIPDVIGFPIKKAAPIVKNAGLAVAVETKPSTSYPPGVVIGEEPSAGTKAARGTTVTLTVSIKSKTSPNVVVPDVLGYKGSVAEQILHAKGLEVHVITQAESNKGQAKKRAGRVWKQSPSAGTSVASGSTVTIWVNPD